MTGCEDLPLVSAIVATYNYADFLPRTLDAALRQDYPADRLEIVVVDDGSSDATPAVIAEYVARYPGRIRAFRQANAGYVAATNRAIEAAHGELWALLDADDLWPPDKTRAQVEIFCSRPEVAAVYGDLQLIDGDDHVLEPSFFEYAKVAPVRGPDAHARMLVGFNPATASSIMVRASLAPLFAPIPAPPMPAPQVFVDWWIVAQAAIGGELEYILEPKAGYRQHGANLTLGTSGAAQVREIVRNIYTRCELLIRNGAAALPVDQLMSAFAMVEFDAKRAMATAGTLFVEIPRPTDARRQLARAHALRADRLRERGRLEEALRTLVLSAAENPYDFEVHSWLVDVAKRVGAAESDADLLPQARSFVVYATLDEVERSPMLIGELAAVLSDEDLATLFIDAPECDAPELERRLLDVLSRADIDPEQGPDIVAHPSDGIEGAAQMRRSLADVRLSVEALIGLRERYELEIAAVKPPTEVDSSRR